MRLAFALQLPTSSMFCNVQILLSLSDINVVQVVEAQLDVCGTRTVAHGRSPSDHVFSHSCRDTPDVFERTQS